MSCFCIGLLSLSLFGFGTPAPQPTQVAQDEDKPVVAPPPIPDLAPKGWVRNKDLVALKIDRYRTASGSLALDLLAFPATDESAKSWTASFIQHSTKPDRDAGFKVHVLDDDEIKSGSATGPMNTSSPGVDMSTQTVLVVRSGPDRENLMMVVRAIRRAGDPVQVSLRTLPGKKPTDAERAQASKIAFDARLPVNGSAAILGHEAMCQLMTSGLLYPDSSSAKAEQEAGTVGDSKVKRAPALIAIPGPRVPLTGKMLGPLPKGYRMHIWTTNYWVSSDALSTRMNHLHLTQDGQFEKGHFAIAGSMDGSVGTISTGDKNGTTGSVLGSTHPGQAEGAKSVYLKKRAGLDPAKYGTYFISGNEIELRYATGKAVKHRFRTNGFSTLLIDDKRYFASAPKGWEVFRNEKSKVYRDLEGSSLITVGRINQSVSDGEAWLKRFIQRGRKSGLIRTASPITKLQAGRFGVVKSAMVISAPKGALIDRDVYVRYGANSSVSRLVRVERFHGGGGEEKVLKFIEELN